MFDESARDCFAVVAAIEFKLAKTIVEANHLERKTAPLFGQFVDDLALNTFSTKLHTSVPKSDKKSLDKIFTEFCSACSNYFLFSS